MVFLFKEGGEQLNSSGDADADQGEQLLPTPAEQAEDIPHSNIQPSWSLLFWWVLANTCGAIFGALLADAMTGGVFDTCYTCLPRLQSLVISVIAGLIIGAVIGFVEWLVLRTQLRGVSRWVLFTSAAWGIVLPFGNTWFELPVPASLDSVEILGKTVGWLLSFLVIGVVIGFMQYIVLRRHVLRASLWILVNAAAWIIVVLTADFALEISDRLTLGGGDLVSPLQDLVRHSIFLGWFFGTLELTTGLTLLWLLRHPHSQVTATMQGQRRTG